MKVGCVLGSFMSADALKITLLEEWIRDKEGENLEFKEWKTTDSDFDKLARYCTALANEGGGRLIALWLKNSL